MTRSVILVNGVPASGKSTVARAVAGALGWPLLTLDTVKEPFFDHLGTGDRDYNRALGRASYQAIFSLIGDWPAGLGAVVDAWFGFQPPEVLDAHLARAGVGATAEIWCMAPPAVVAERFASRADSRHKGHPGADYAPELAALAARAAPIGRGPLVTIDTTRPLDIAALIAWIAENLPGSRES